MTLPNYHHRILSFKYAFEGLKAALKEEPNLKFHFLAAALVIILGAILQISKTEWMIVLILMGLVISVELTNTALEELVDSFTEKEHPGAKLAKDVSASAVLVVAATAAVVGAFIFLPQIWKLFSL